MVREQRPSTLFGQWVVDVQPCSVNLFQEEKHSVWLCFLVICYVSLKYLKGKIGKYAIFNKCTLSLYMCVFPVQEEHKYRGEGLLYNAYQ